LRRGLAYTVNKKRGWRADLQNIIVVPKTIYIEITKNEVQQVEGRVGEKGTGGVLLEGVAEPGGITEGANEGGVKALGGGGLLLENTKNDSWKYTVGRGARMLLGTGGIST